MHRSFNLIECSMNNLCFSSSLALANIRKEDSIWNQLWFDSHETGVQTQTCFDLNQYVVDLCLRIELLLSAKEQIESKVSFSRRGSIQLAHLVVNPHILSCEDDNRYGMLWYCMVWRKTSWRTKLSCWNFLLSHWKKSGDLMFYVSSFGTNDRDIFCIIFWICMNL